MYTEKCILVLVIYLVFHGVIGEPLVALGWLGHLTVDWVAGVFEVIYVQ